MRIDWLGGGGGGSGGAAGVGRWVDDVQPVLNLLQSCFNQHLQMVASQDLSETEISRTLATKYPTNQPTDQIRQGGKILKPTCNSSTWFKRLRRHSSRSKRFGSGIRVGLVPRTACGILRSTLLVDLKEAFFFWKFLHLLGESMVSAALRDVLHLKY